MSDFWFDEMPLALIILGILLIVTAYQGTYKALGTQIYNDFTGAAGSGFVYWVVAVALIGAIGYIKPMKTPSRMLLALIVLAFFLANGGLWDKLKQGLSNPTRANAQPLQPAPGALPVQISGAGGGGGLGGILGALTGGGGSGGAYASGAALAGTGGL